MFDSVPTFDLGRLSYAAAYAVQLAHHAEVLAARDSSGPHAHLLLVEHHPPVITVSRRPNARAHLLATPEALARAGVTVEETDRGGDITYHGPGQLVVYPIVDLNAFGLGLHVYMRLLEGAVIETCAEFGLLAHRDPQATGVWVASRTTTPEQTWPRKDTDSHGFNPQNSTPDPCPSVSIRGNSDSPAPPAKIAALGVRIRRWVTLHGLALNVTTKLAHFDLIVPCGLAGRSVTSLERELPQACPTMATVKARLVENLTRHLVVSGQTAHE